MAWYLRIFPEYKKEIAQYTQVILSQAEDIRNANKLASDSKNFHELIEGAALLIKKGYEIVNIAEHGGVFKIVAVTKNSDYLFTSDFIAVEIYSVMNGKFLPTKEYLEAEICVKAYTHCERIKINDLIATPNSGNGGLLLDGLIKYIKKRNEGTVSNIFGMLEPIDYRDHSDRLIHFYTKHGFKVFDTDEPDRKRIRLELDTAENLKIDELITEIAKLRKELDDIKQTPEKNKLSGLFFYVQNN